jgi:hypothetical protein
MNKDTLVRANKAGLWKLLECMKRRRVQVVSMLSVESVILIFESIILAVGVFILYSYPTNFLGISLTILSIFSLFVLISHTLCIFLIPRLLSKLQYRVLVIGIILFSYSILIAIHIYISISTHQILYQILQDLSDSQSCKASSFLTRYFKPYLISSYLTSLPSHTFYCNETVILNCPCYQNSDCLAEYAIEIEALSYMEQEFDCGGVCEEMPQYFSTGKSSEISCGNAIKERVKKAGEFLIGILGLISALMILAAGLFGWSETIRIREEAKVRLYMKNESAATLYRRGGLRQDSTNREDRNNLFLQLDNLDKIESPRAESELPQLLSRQISSNFISHLPTPLRTQNPLNPPPVSISHRSVSRNSQESSEKRPFYHTLQSLVPSHINSSRFSESYVIKADDPLPDKEANSKNMIVLTPSDSSDSKLYKL